MEEQLLAMRPVPAPALASPQRQKSSLYQQQLQDTEQDQDEDDDDDDDVFRRLSEKKQPRPSGGSNNNNNGTRRDKPFATTQLDVPVKAGSSELYCNVPAGCMAGMVVVIGEGLDNEEQRLISGFASILIDQPLTHAHPIGTPITIYDPKHLSSTSANNNNNNNNNNPSSSSTVTPVHTSVALEGDTPVGLTPTGGTPLGVTPSESQDDHDDDDDESPPPYTPSCTPNKQGILRLIMMEGSSHIAICLHIQNERMLSSDSSYYHLPFPTYRW